MRTHRDMLAPSGKTRVLRWDPYLEPDEGDMEFRLTYSGDLLVKQGERRVPERSLHVHRIRKLFHLQLEKLWQFHPSLSTEASFEKHPRTPIMRQRFTHDGFTWLPMVTKDNSLICKLDILMLREGHPGGVLFDTDNKLKTLFDALRMADGPNELGNGTSAGQQRPEAHEEPFYVLLQNDNLITHVSVTTDTLLEPVPNVAPENAVRLILNVTIRPYHAHMENLHYA